MSTYVSLTSSQQPHIAPVLRSSTIELSNQAGPEGLGVSGQLSATSTDEQASLEDDALPEMPNDEAHPYAFGQPIRLDAEQTAAFRRMANAKPPDWFRNALARRKRQTPD